MSDPPPSSFAAHSDVNQFSLSNGTFVPPHVIPVPVLPERAVPMTSDLQTQGQMVDQGSFVHPAGLSNRLQDLNSLTTPAASAPPGAALMDASSMGCVQTQGDPQNHQPCKYDLLSSVPREYNLSSLRWNCRFQVVLMLQMISWDLHRSTRSKKICWEP